MNNLDKTYEQTKEYYGKILQKSTDLKTNACCTSIKYPKHILNAMKNIHDDVMSSYYGCGLTIPDCLDNCKVMDLGCGTGRDVYLLSQFVGEKGSVIGIDMTDEQINKAKKYKDFHADKNNYAESNVNFCQGYIENIDDALSTEGENDNLCDVIVSNCVINLSPNKKAVLQQVYKHLKEGGELYFSDVYSSQRIPQTLQEDKVLWGECLSGALYWNDFINLAKECGFTDPRLVESSPITIENKEVQNLIGHIEFYSATYRLFKLPNLESDCEDYGQAVVYKGSIENSPNYWDLDGHHRMWKNKVFPVCGNTWNMLAKTRFSKHFEFIGNFDTHYGIFQGCGKNMPFVADSSAGSSCC